MNYYESKYNVLPGTSYEEVLKLARGQFHAIQKRNPRRQAYIRSQYFNKDKIFMTIFWDHLSQKRRVDKLRRLKYYACAIDLLRHSTLDPEIVIEKGQILYRFAGIAKDDSKFFIQVKVDKRTGRKDFMSVYPLG
jgi:hypothetical protein